MTLHAADRCEDHAWFKRRGYPHFDRQLNLEQAVELVTDPEQVARRAFLPFISFDVIRWRYRTEKIRAEDGKVKSKKGCVEAKTRPVAFASHADSLIFSYYAHLLKPKYESLLDSARIDECVLAYRRFDPPRCNIHFAEEVFKVVERAAPCMAVAIDIESFFDTIPHDLLKTLWAEVLGTDRLPNDHYAVFRAVTKWASVDRDQVFEQLDIGLRRRRRWRGPLCTPTEFRGRIRGNSLIKTNMANRGIPQGSPISALLSNIVMLNVDRQIAGKASRMRVMYRRYSDDVLFVGPEEAVRVLERDFVDAVNAMGLSVNDEKTKRSHFQVDSTGKIVADTPLQYLGFTFDGQNVLVRPQTLSKYIQRMLRAVDSAKRAARASATRGGSRRLRRQEIYARYSHLGPTKNMLDRDKSNCLRNNFWTYAIRSAGLMDRPEIKGQLRKHWPRLNKAIQIADTDEQ